LPSLGLGGDTIRGEENDDIIGDEVSCSLIDGLTILGIET
jgi:hypothetical protein